MKLTVLPASTGARWVREGLRTFWRQPMALSGLFGLFMLTVTLIGQIPYVGLVLAMTLLPAATLGFMAATHEATQARFPLPAILLAALRAGQQQRRSMLALGLGYAAGFLGAMGVSALVDGGTFAQLYLGHGGGTPHEAMLDTQFQLALLTFLSLHLPLSLAFWHAPALVHWQQMPVLKSLFFSLVVCVRNFGAYTVFGVGWFLVVSLVVLGLSMIGLALGNPGLVVQMLYPALLLLTAMFFTSLYFTYRDSFGAPSGAVSSVA